MFFRIYYVQWRVNGKLYMRSTKKRDIKDAREDDSPALSRQIQEHFTACGIRTIKKGTGFETKVDKDGKPRRVSTGKRAAVEVGFHSLRHSFVSLCPFTQRPPIEDCMREVIVCVWHGKVCPYANDTLSEK